MCVKGIFIKIELTYCYLFQSILSEKSFIYLKALFFLNSAIVEQYHHTRKAILMTQLCLCQSLYGIFASY